MGARFKRHVSRRTFCVKPSGASFIEGFNFRMRSAQFFVEALPKAPPITYENATHTGIGSGLLNICLCSKIGRTVEKE
jgi:hypothetical protein